MNLKNYLKLTNHYYNRLRFISWNSLICRSNKVILEDKAVVVNPRIKISGNNNVINFGVQGSYRNLHIQIIGMNNRIEFLHGSKVNGHLIILIEGDNCLLQIGAETTIGSAKIQLGESGTSVIIGKDNMISRDVTITTSDFHSILDAETLERINPPRNVIIGDKVWIGNGVYINKGTQIGSNSIIAAKSVCVKSTYSCNSILAGVPAKVVKQKVTWSREKIPV